MSEKRRFEYKVGVFSLVVILHVCLFGCSIGTDDSKVSQAGDSGSQEQVRIEGDMNSNFQPTVELATRGKATEQDPFCRIPLGWPEDILIHPDARVISGIKHGTAGFQLTTLISPEICTILGVQDKHLKLLGGCEAVDDYDDSPEGSENPSKLRIEAACSNAHLTILIEKANLSLIQELDNDNIEYWLENIGPEPIVIRIIYSPVPEYELN